jgi:zinc protease
VFGDGPYGHPLGGTPESVKRLARADFVRFHATYYRPDNAVLVIGGDIPAPDAFALARDQFGDWKRPAAALPALRRAAGAALSPPPPLPGRGRVVVIDKPDAGQAAVYLARAGIRRTDPDYFKAIVVNSVLGGGFSARLNQEIRIKRGLSYGASSSLDARREAGPFVAAAQCKNEAAGEVAALLRAELARLEAEPVPAAELTPRKAALTGGYARGLETTGGLVAQVASLALYGLPAGEINRFIGGVGAVGGEDVRAFARTRLSASGAHLVVVGDAKQFLGDLRRRLPEVPVEVIPVARLDLNRAVLRR